MPQYRDDPRWIEARYPGRCHQCGREITKGARAFYYPKGRTLFCEADACGGAASRDFEAAAMDEALYSGRAW